MSKWLGEARGRVIDIYMTQRSILIARVIELQRNYPSEYGEKLRDTKNEIERIDKIVGGLLASPNHQDQVPR